MTTQVEVHFHLQQARNAAGKIRHQAVCEGCGEVLDHNSTQKAMLAICAHMIAAHDYDMLSV